MLPAASPAPFLARVVLINTNIRFNVKVALITLFVKSIQLFRRLLLKIVFLLLPCYSFTLIKHKVVYFNITIRHLIFNYILM